MTVHNHGPAEGNGLSCPEYRVSAVVEGQKYGRLIGQCLLHNPGSYKFPCGGDKCLNNPCCEDGLVG